MVSEQQKKIIESTSKRIIVLACPGSGKTTTLINKIVSLCNDKNVKLKNVLSVTFTRKAAMQMRDKLIERIPVSKSERRNICTLHSLGCRILWKYKDIVGLKDDFTVATRGDKGEIVESILPPEKCSDEIISSFLNYVSSIKNGFENNKDNFTFEDFEKYNSKMIERNLIDIDDYIYLPVQILSKNNHIKEKYNRQYQYVFVDEYQDINKMQNDFLDLLIVDKTNVLYVGDDDQSIYEFRGSNPNFILEKSAPGSGYDVYYLSINFRSQKPIVDLSKKVLEKLVYDRRDKLIESYKNENTPKPVRRIPFDEKEEEVDYVANEIYRLIVEGNAQPNEIAVLSRYTSKKNCSGNMYHSELSEIERKLKEKGINASTSITMDGDNEASKQIKKLCKTLLAFNHEKIMPEDCNFMEGLKAYRKANYPRLLQLINEKYRIELSGDDQFASVMDTICELNAKNKIELETKAFQKQIENLINAYSFFKKQFDLVHSGAMPSEIILNLITYINSEKKGYENLEEIYEYGYKFAKEAENDYESDIDSDENESQYKSVVSLLNLFLCAKEKDNEKNSVRLLTAHQSKGLEFDVVFIVGLEAGGFPCNFEKLEGKVLDNERRLFYVCVTRAKELLYLTSTGIANSKDLVDKSFIYTLPSTYFIDEIESFEEINFTLSDNESARLKEKDQMIDQLEKDQFLSYIKLNEYLKTIEYLQKKVDENNNIELEVERLNNQLSNLSDEIKGKNISLKQSQREIEKLQKNEAYYEAEIRRLESLPQSPKITKERDDLKEKLDNETNTRKKLENDIVSLNQNLNELNGVIVDLKLKIEFLNKKLKTEVDEKKKIESEMEKLKSTIKDLTKKMSDKDNYSIKLSRDINQLKDNEKALLQKIKYLESLTPSEEVIKEKEEYLSKYNNERVQREYLEEQCKTINIEREKAQKLCKDLKDKLNDTQNENENDELKKTISTISKDVNNIKAKEYGNAIDLIYETIVKLPDDIISKKIKDIIIELYKICVSNSRYSVISNAIRYGLSGFQDMVDASVEYINGRIQKEQYISVLRPASYKTNLCTLVRNILENCTKYYGKNVDNNDSKKQKENVNKYVRSDFSISGFLSAYLKKHYITKQNTNEIKLFLSKDLSISEIARRRNCHPAIIAIFDYGKDDEIDQNNDGQYESLVDEYDKEYEFGNCKMLPKQLVGDMYIMYAISTIANHDEKAIKNKAAKHYQNVVTDFLEHPGQYYFDVLSSFFLFIDLFVNTKYMNDLK